MYYELEQVPECTTHIDTHESSTNSLVLGSLRLIPIIEKVGEKRRDKALKNNKMTY